MLTCPVVLRFAVIAIIPAVVACNSMLGVDDVAPTQPSPDGGLSQPGPDAPAMPPDAPPANCNVVSHFPTIRSSPTTSILGRRMDGGQTLLFLLNEDAKPDIFGVLLFNGRGGHSTLDAPGMYPITQADSQPAPSCGLCVVAYTDVELNGSVILPSYFAIAQGSLTVTRADSAGMAGHLDNLRLRHVDRTGATLNDGCMVQIDQVLFDMPYDPGATNSITGAIHGAVAAGTGTTGMLTIAE